MKKKEKPSIPPLNLKGTLDENGRPLSSGTQADLDHKLKSRNIPQITPEESYKFATERFENMARFDNDNYLHRREAYNMEREAQREADLMEKADRDFSSTTMICEYKPCGQIELTYPLRENPSLEREMINAGLWTAGTIIINANPANENSTNGQQRGYEKEVSEGVDQDPYIYNSLEHFAAEEYNQLNHNFFNSLMYGTHINF